MANPPKQKGTAGETEFVRYLASHGIVAKRTSPGMNYDVFIPGDYDDAETIPALATRPDRGRWLVTVDIDTFADLIRDYAPNGVQPGYTVEVKRYARFALHNIWNKKFGGKA